MRIVSSHKTMMQRERGRERERERERERYRERERERERGGRQTDIQKSRQTCK